jgi:Protein of unknown function (DUF4232)
VRASVRIAGRVAAAVAFGATAALAVTLTRGAPLHAALVSARHLNPVSRHIESSAPQCAASGLNVSIASSSPADSAASIARRAASHAAPQGATRFPVEFTNISDAPCTLNGYPQVSAYGAGGAQLGNAAGLDMSASATRILLAPGATAHAAIVDSAAGARCKPVAATGLRVVPPGESMPWYVRHALPACSATGHEAAVFLRVRALQYGTGLPARTHASANAKTAAKAIARTTKAKAKRHAPSPAPQG